MFGFEMRPMAVRLLLLAIVAAVTFGALAVYVNSTEAGAIVGFTVNSSTDLGDAIPGDGICDTVVGEPRICGMRTALEEANALNGPNDITFTAANTVLGSDLPDITERINIDASTNPDGFTIDAAGAADDGLVLALGSSGSIIRALDIENAPGGSALLICGGASHTIGGDPSVGVAPAGQGNIFRDSSLHGIEIVGGLALGDCDTALGSLGGHMIWGNRIGTLPLGTAADGNGSDGIHISGGSGPDILIGGGAKMPNGKTPAGDPPAGWPNLISGNGSDGIDFNGGSPDPIIWGNWIGLGVLGNATDEFANGTHGIYVSANGAEIINNSLAGGGVDGSDNPGDSGIQAEANGTLILGNCIGFDHSCVSSSGGFSSDTIDLEDGDDNIVGDGTEAGRNVIGNGGDEGIDMHGDGNVIDGNYVGFGKDGETNAHIRSDDCINIDGGDDNEVTNNLVGNCEETAINVNGDGNLVQNNDIGRGTEPTTADPIEDYCIEISGDDNQILDNVVANCDATSPDSSIELESGSFNTISGNDVTSPIGEDAIDIQGTGIGNLVASQTFRMITPGDGDLPIDLIGGTAVEGTDVNDAGDLDTCANTNCEHNYPVFPPASVLGGCAVGSAGPFDMVRIYSKTTDGLDVTYDRLAEGTASLSGDFEICDLGNVGDITVVGTATTTLASTTDTACAINCTSEFSVTEQTVPTDSTPTPTVTDTPEATVTPTPAPPTDTPTPAPPTEVPTDVPPTAEPKVCGDVSGDGTVNAVDATIIFQLKAGLLSSLDNESSADVNNSGDITSVDGALILQVGAGLITEAALTCPA